MVYENEFTGSTMPSYQFQQQQTQMPVFYNDMYDDRSFYYQPNNMYGGYMGGPMNWAYMSPNMYGAYPSNVGMNHYMPSYLNEESYAAYSEAPTEGTVSNRVVQQFLDENGQVDIQKMLSTVGQFADTVQQVSPVIKQLNDLVRSFRA